MNVTKSAIVVAAMLITAAGMAGITRYSNAAADSARSAIHATTAAAVITLPAVEVRPTPEQLRELRGTDVRPGSASAASVEAPMPYYSFASGEAGA